MSGDTSTQVVADRLAILQVIHDWVFCRDNGEWEALRALFAAEGRMATFGASQSADEFVSYGRVLREAGALSHHFVGPSRVRLNGDKALAETSATLNIRAALDGVAVDVTVLLRYLDRFVREAASWKIYDRQPIYIKDRLDPVIPGTHITLDHDMLAEGPEGCRFLVYVSRASGAPAVDLQRYTFNTPEAAELTSAADVWLDG